MGANIRAARKTKGLTQSELAQQLGVPDMHISRWERGKHRPSDESLGALGKALDLEYVDFFREPERQAA